MSTMRNEIKSLYWISIWLLIIVASSSHVLKAFAKPASSVLVPTAVEIRLVGLADVVNIETLQEALDSLSTTDVQLFPTLQLGISYKVRAYDNRISETDLEQTRTGDDLAKADEIDQQISERHEPYQGFVIYVLHSKKRRRAYASDPTRSGDEYCATQVWSSDKDRFGWIDLAALDPASDYGPLLNGEGYVSFGRAVPRPEDFSLSSFHSRLAALCHRTSLHLAVPSLSHSRPFADPFQAKTVRAYLITSSSNDKGNEQLRQRWETHFLGPLRSVAKVLNANLSFEVVIVPLESCSVCAAAHELAIRLRERTDDLDPQKLREILLPRFSTSDGPSVGAMAPPVFSMFVYRTESGPFLFEGSRQSVVFDNCVVAVEGTSTEITIPTNFQCREQGRAVTLDASDVSRQVLAGAMRSVFGVSATFERFSTALGRFTDDFLFAVGHTPFGPFSRSTRPSKALMDAAWRNPVLWHLAESMQAMNKLQGDIAGLNFVRRPELLRLLEEAETFARRSAGFVGLLDIDHAKELAMETRTRIGAAQQIYSELVFATDCFVPVDESSYAREWEADSNSLTMMGFSLIPVLLIFLAGAVFYETRVAKMRTFVRGAGAGGGDFVTPAKKVD